MSIEVYNMSYKVTGNVLPKIQRYYPEAYWYRLTVSKHPHPYMTPARGKVKKLYDSFKGKYYE